MTTPMNVKPLTELHQILSYTFFFLHETATTAIYTLSLHDALPICLRRLGEPRFHFVGGAQIELFGGITRAHRSEEHTSELQSHHDLVCRLLLEKKNTNRTAHDDKSLTVPVRGVPAIPPPVHRIHDY